MRVSRSRAGKVGSQWSSDRTIGASQSSLKSSASANSPSQLEQLCPVHLQLWAALHCRGAHCGWFCAWLGQRGVALRAAGCIDAAGSRCTRGQGGPGAAGGGQNHRQLKHFHAVCHASCPSFYCCTCAVTCCSGSDLPLSLLQIVTVQDGEAFITFYPGPSARVTGKPLWSPQVKRAISSGKSLSFLLLNKQCSSGCPVLFLISQWVWTTALRHQWLAANGTLGVQRTGGIPQPITSATPWLQLSLYIRQRCADQGHSCSTVQCCLAQPCKVMCSLHGDHYCPHGNMVSSPPRASLQAANKLMDDGLLQAGADRVCLIADQDEW